MLHACSLSSCSSLQSHFLCAPEIPSFSAIFHPTPWQMGQVWTGTTSILVVSVVGVLEVESPKIGVVFRRIVVHFLHLWAILLHDLLVEPDRGLISVADEALVFAVLGLDIVEVVP